MIVAVSMRTAEAASYAEARDAISGDWIRLLDRLSVTPVLVPNELMEPERVLAATAVRALLLTGGDDLGPLADEAGSSRAGSPNRDRTENGILRHALEAGLPVFGVCRGMQLINVWFGGGLTRTLPPGHVRTQHRVDLVDVVVGNPGVAPLVTNSFHGQGVREEDLAPVLRPFATAPDGVVEGLYHPDLPVWGVQWHPERENPASALDDALLQRWLDRCD